ncbi:unnamed protein product [Vitrella brassicaformis CCMP3155]|uniref:Uncharacterized protein n=2 Tax=Vitrella brassicaformis TaxID=1169539 RepID=A0A0G4FDM9_VITBC|nr:unnamed protein product [Vitrella brassicaformis CCMP3155]|eukprot:CEM11068.1 unnamed protein product [Vitrella brassicaformis CCMP3155]
MKLIFELVVGLLAVGSALSFVVQPSVHHQSPRTLRGTRLHALLGGNKPKPPPGSPNPKELFTYVPGEKEVDFDGVTQILNESVDVTEEWRLENFGDQDNGLFGFFQQILDKIQNRED